MLINRELKMPFIPYFEGFIEYKGSSKRNYFEETKEILKSR
jgi:hypothetical protein